MGEPGGQAAGLFFRAGSNPVRSPRMDGSAVHRRRTTTRPDSLARHTARRAVVPTGGPPRRFTLWNGLHADAPRSADPGS